MFSSKIINPKNADVLLKNVNFLVPRCNIHRFYSFLIPFCQITKMYWMIKPGTNENPPFLKWFIINIVINYYYYNRCIIKTINNQINKYIKDILERAIFCFENVVFLLVREIYRFLRHIFVECLLGFYDHTYYYMWLYAGYNFFSTDFALSILSKWWWCWLRWWWWWNLTFSKKKKMSINWIVNWMLHLT